MHVEVVTPPAEVVSVDEAKAHLRVDFEDDDDLIEGMVAAATGALDGPDGILNRALSEQVLRATLEGFPYEHHRAAWPSFSHHHLRDHPRGLALRCEPIRAVSAVTYIAADGSEQTVDPATYQLTADGRLRLAYGQCWPSPRACDDPVTVTYSAGYDALPKPLRAAILLMVGDLYENRDAQVISDTRVTAVSNVTVDRLIGPFKNLRA